MSAHLERARLHLAQSRPADAERECMQALAHQPDDPNALSLLALSRVDQGKNDAALEAAREAVGLAPDQPYLHYVHALVLHRLDREEAAMAAITEAVRLDPSDADHFSLVASIELARRNWPAALEAAERALALNPEHVNAINLRAMALVRLGRKEEATATVDFALERAPSDAFSHANQGWNCLHRNDPKAAQEHFREALRLDPSLEYAREGMLEALKARNPVYRGMLAYFLWMGRQGTKLQWGFILAIWFGGRIVRQFAEKNPEQGWFWWSLLGLLYAFVYLSWTAQPMFNLFLRLDRFGRHVLSADQRMASNWFGATLGLALVAGAYWAIGGTELGMFATIFLAILSICVAMTFSFTGGKRQGYALATAGLAVCAAATLFLTVSGREDAANATLALFSIGFIGLQLAANFTRK